TWPMFGWRRRWVRYVGGVLALGLTGCGGASSSAPFAQPEGPVEEASVAPFRDPLADAEPIRFSPREPLDPADVPHAAQLAAVCPEPLYDEVRGLMGCGTCPSDDGFAFPAESERGALRRGELRMAIHS